MQDTPHVDATIADYVEDQIRKATERPGSQVWDPELVGEAQRADEWRPTHPNNSAFDDVDELQCDRFARLTEIVINGPLDVGCCKRAKFDWASGHLV